ISKLGRVAHSQQSTTTQSTDVSLNCPALILNMRLFSFVSAALATLCTVNALSVPLNRNEGRNEKDEEFNVGVEIIEHRAVKGDSETQHGENNAVAGLVDSLVDPLIAELSAVAASGVKIVAKTAGHVANAVLGVTDQVLSQFEGDPDAVGTTSGGAVNDNTEGAGNIDAGSTGNTVQKTVQGATEEAGV
ncbi:hypothetical protein C8R43DRAFT_655256, partial [Mycena crocata]